MSVEVKQTSELGRELSFVVDEQQIAAEREKIVAAVQREAFIEGFRKGKVPRAIVEARFQDAIRERLLQNIIPRVYVDAVREEKLMPVVDPEVSDVSLEGNRLTFKVHTEVRPEVTLGKYAGLTLKKAERETVNDEKVDKVLTEWEKKPEFAVSIIDPEKRRAWREKIRGQMEYVAETQAVLREESQIWEQLLAGAKFPVPERLVQEKSRHYAEEQLHRMNLSGKSEAEVEQLAKETLEKVKPAAEKDVRRYFILERIAEAEKITADPAEVAERVTRMSRAAGEPEEEIRRKLEESGKIHDLEEEIRMDKAFRFVMEKAQRIEKVVLPGEK